MHLHFLGTGAGSPSKQRNVSSVALDLSAERGEIWLFDCGEATQHTILRTRIRPGKIAKIFITHLHGDHLFGLPGLVGSRSFLGGDTPLEIYGPAGIRRFIETALEVSDSRIGYPLSVTELAESGTAFDDGRFRADYRSLDHRVQSYGFRITEAGRPGSLDTQALAAAGIAPGPQYGVLKQGGSIRLPDGRTVCGADYLSPPQPGRSVALFGDTRYVSEHAAFCRNADVLVHEATFGAGEEELAERYGHSTAAQAAALARDAQVRRLILTHISARHNGNTEALLSAAQAVFPETALAEDLSEFPVPFP